MCTHCLRALLAGGGSLVIEQFKIDRSACVGACVVLYWYWYLVHIMGEVYQVK